MVTHSSTPWAVRLGTLALWAAAGASLVFWGLRLSAPAAGPAAAGVLPMAPAAPDARALARLLGAVPAAPGDPVASVASAASRFVLVGVLAGRQSGAGAALIAVDGKAAKPFRVGAVVDQGLVLQSLGPRQARLGPALGEPATLTLEMPLLKR